MVSVVNRDYRDSSEYVQVVVESQWIGTNK